MGTPRGTPKREKSLSASSLTSLPPRVYRARSVDGDYIPYKQPPPTEEPRPNSNYDGLPLAGRLGITGLGILLTFIVLVKKYDVDDKNPQQIPAQDLHPIVPPQQEEEQPQWFMEEGNACLSRKLEADGMKCASFVVNATDAVWHPLQSDDDVEASFFDSYAPGFRSHDAKGVVRSGLAASIQDTFDFRRAFPDLQVHVANVVCEGNDIDGYKSSTTKIFVGTNTGDSATYGPATNHRVAYPAITNALIIKDSLDGFRFQAEWNLKNDLLLLKQLGLAPPDSSDSSSSSPSTTHNSALVAPPNRCEQTVAGWGYSS